MNMKIFPLLIAICLLTACTQRDTSTHIDMQSETRNRPVVHLTQEDGTELPGFSGSYCTDVLCMDYAAPDYSALTYTPFVNGSPLTFSVDFEDEIHTISIRTINTSGKITHRELPFEQVDSKTFLVSEAFPDDETQVTLHFSVDFIVEGSANYYFPVELK